MFNGFISVAFLFAAILFDYPVQSFLLQPSPRIMTSSIRSSSASGSTLTRRKGRRVMIGDIMHKANGSISTTFCPCADCPPTSPPSLLYCSAVNDVSDSDSEDSFTSDASKSTKSSSISSSLTSWKDKLLKASNFASLLCVVDCTLLPIITFLLPLVGLMAVSPAQMEWLHELGHKVALYFVMPVGLTATSTNYFNHKKFWITAIGWIGLTLIYCANAGASCGAAAAHVHDHVHSHVHSHVHAHGQNILVKLAGMISHSFGHTLEHAVKAIEHGIAHRIANLSGCFLLILSNYISRKTAPHVHGPNCSHSHDHVHGPDCNH